MAAGPETSAEEEGDVDAVRAAGGRGRFYMESKPALGLLLLKGKKPHHRQETRLVFWGKICTSYLLKGSGRRLK